jgi:hypothetical protein
MGQKSSIAKLPPDLREVVEQLIAAGSATIEQIVEHVRALGGTVSKSAVGRFKQKADAQLARFREANEVAGAWTKAFAADPESDVGRVLQQMLSTIAFRSLTDVETMDPRDLMFLGKALKDLAGAQKLSTEMIDKALAKRQAQLEAQAAAAKTEIETVAKNAGISDTTVEMIYAALKGAIA